MSASVYVDQYGGIMVGMIYTNIAACKEQYAAIETAASTFTDKEREELIVKSVYSNTDGFLGIAVGHGSRFIPITWLVGVTLPNNEWGHEHDAHMLLPDVDSLSEAKFALADYRLAYNHK
jgi:hypothetical protein